MKGGGKTKEKHWLTLRVQTQRKCMPWYTTTKKRKCNIVIFVKRVKHFFQQLSLVFFTVDVFLSFFLLQNLLNASVIDCVIKPYIICMKTVDTDLPSPIRNYFFNGLISLSLCVADKQNVNYSRFNVLDNIGIEQTVIVFVDLRSRASFSSRSQRIRLQQGLPFTPFRKSHGFEIWCLRHLHACTCRCTFMFTCVCACVCLCMYACKNNTTEGRTRKQTKMKAFSQYHFLKAWRINDTWLCVYPLSRWVTGTKGATAMARGSLWHAGL